MSITIPSSFRGPWVPVMIAKKNEDGEVECAQNGEPILTHRLLDERNGNFYLYNLANTVNAIRTKCLLITLAIPFYAAGQMLWSTGRLFVDVGVIACRALREFADDWQTGHDIGDLISRFGEKIKQEVPEREGKNIRHIVSAPFYAIGVLGHAMHGAFSPSESAPLEARKEVAAIEYQWQDGLSYKQHPEYQGIWNASASHLAHCFQPRGNIENGRHFIYHFGSERI